MKHVSLIVGMPVWVSGLAGDPACRGRPNSFLNRPHLAPYYPSRAGSQLGLPGMGRGGGDPLWSPRGGAFSKQPPVTLGLKAASPHNLPSETLCCLLLLCPPHCAPFTTQTPSSEKPFLTPGGHFLPICYTPGHKAGDGG